MRKRYYHKDTHIPIWIYIGAIVVSIVGTYLVVNSDMPTWLKFWLLS